MSRVTVGPRAQEDALDIFDFLEQEAGGAVAERFLAAVSSTTASLRALPLRGAPRPMRRPGLESMRMLAVRGFENYLMFDRCEDDAALVDRILHGFRDIDRTLRDGDLPDAVREVPIAVAGTYALPEGPSWRVAC